MAPPSAIVDASVLYSRHLRNALIWHSLEGLFELRSLVDEMTNHPKDRHVLAAAVAAKARFVVTANLKDFRPADTRPRGVEALSPDSFLTDLLNEAGALQLCASALAHQASFHGWSVAELLALLGQPGEYRPAWLPRYVRGYERLAGSSPTGLVD